MEDAAEIAGALKQALSANSRGVTAVLDFQVKREWPQIGYDLFAAMFGK